MGAGALTLAFAVLLALAGCKRDPSTDGAPSEPVGTAVAAITGTANNASNFNGTAIAAGTTLWFTSAAKVQGLGSTIANIYITNSSIVFTANGQNYNLPVPNAQITIDPSATTATTTFNTSTQTWQTTLPKQFSGNGFLTALSYPVPANLPGGINPVTWTATFTSDTSGLTVQWQWAAAVYTQFGSSYGALEVKPVDDNHVSQYQNSDHAGTPEAFKSFVVGGARGGGGSNYTGSLSGTVAVTPLTSNLCTGVTCTASDQCHVAGTCNPSTGVCSNPDAANGTTCNDGNACTTGDVCTSGVCAGTAVTCTASDQCHVAGTCDPGTGICSNPSAANGTTCNDGNACTTGDACTSGVCAGTAVTCTASDQCHVAGTCDSSTGICSNPNAANGTVCNDGNACTTSDICTSGICGGTAVTCTASDQCHIAGTCNPSTGTCSNPAAANGTSCNDGNACTTGDVCTSGVCGGTAVTCTASDQCHTAGTCNPSTGTCSSPTKANGTACNDGNACTTSDVCTSGVCGGTAVTCMPSDQCHVAGTCNPSTGTCSNPNKADGSTCNDGNACTTSDVCTSGVCGGTAVTCTPSDQCHVAGTCNPSTGTCSNPAATNDTACNDGNACTQTDTCQSGSCVGSNPVTCTPSDQCHVAGTCNPSSGTCSNPAASNGTACNDGNACTQTDTCQSGACAGSNSVTCTAIDQCHTAGTCDPTTGTCSSPAKADGSACNDGNACTTNDACTGGVCGGTPVTCTATDQCHTSGTCNPSTGTCSNPAATNGTACNDGNACTTSDICTNGSCAGTAITCAALDGCHVAGTCNPSTGTCSNPNAANGTGCNDGNACTTGDVCTNGACAGTAVTCTAADSCHGAGTCDPATGICSSPAKTNGAACDNGNACTENDTCQASCSPASLTVAFAASAFCAISPGGDGGAAPLDFHLSINGSSPIPVPVDCTQPCTAVQTFVVTDASVLAALHGCNDAFRVTRDPTSGFLGVIWVQVSVANESGPASSLCVFDETNSGCFAASAADGGTGGGPIVIGGCGPSNFLFSPVSATGTCPGTCTGSTVSCVPGTVVTCPAPDSCHAAGTCDPTSGECMNPALPDGTTCSDGNACDTASCQAGSCVVQATEQCPPPGNSCQLQGSCNPTSGFCTFPTVPDGTACTDGDPCTLTAACQEGYCYATALVQCPASDSCHAASYCDSTTGQCAPQQALSDGTACNDGNACTQTDTCVAGTCVGSSPVTCSAPSQCYVGVCNPASGQCGAAPAPDGTACNDFNGCTTSDVCTAGLCGGTPVVCPAPDQCHVGSCDPVTGQCSSVPAADGTACNDGNACTLGDTCQQGTCAGTSIVICTAADACHAPGICDPTSGVCSTPTKPDGTFCNNGNACTQTAACQAGVCVGSNPVVCVAIDQCHGAGTCDPATGYCSQPALPDGTACNDGNPCTQTDTCQGGGCFGSNTVVCVASDQCHVAGFCLPSTGKCSNPVAPDETPCNDGIACTTNDQCSAGTCHGTPVLCTASDQCHTAGTCNPSTGTCSNPPVANGTACNDGNACTSNDACTNGICGGTANTCTASDSCHLAGTCNPSTGTCSNPPVANGTTCNDGNACTQTDTCQGGACVGVNPITCSASDQCHVAGTCDPSSGCSNPPAANGTACDDGNVCTTNDVCTGGVCGGGTPVVCTASDQCHVAGTCDPSTGCSNPPAANGTTCNDGNACTASDVCTAGVCGGTTITCAASDQCHVAGTCDPGSGCSNPAAPNGTACNDGNACTKTDRCESGTCVGSSPVTCAPADACHAASTCDPSTGMCSTPTVLVGAACSTGNSCQVGVCSIAGLCQITGSVPAGTACSDGNMCNGSETCDGAGNCAAGTPLPNGTSCNLDPCTPSACSMGQCVPGSALPDGSSCDDGSTCRTGATCHGGACNAGTNDGSSCDDGDVCNGVETCKGGTCVAGTPVAAVSAPGDLCHSDLCDPITGAVTQVTCTPINLTAPTDVYAASAFIIAAQPGAIIDPKRITVLRGNVFDTSGAPLPNVSIAVLTDAAPGKARTRLDGHFDMAVNGGGGRLTIRYSKPGYLSVDRPVVARWKQYSKLPDVTLTRLDASVTPVLPDAASFQVARGSIMQDASGTRRATLLIPPGTAAAFVFPDGSQTPVTGTLSVRATEFTVGPSGPSAMPAPLPAASTYTYAVDLFADEATALGATQVQFFNAANLAEPQTVYAYVENFLGLPVGGAMPSGYYDPTIAAWIATPDGRVIEVLSVSGGTVTLATQNDGMGNPVHSDSDEQALGITDAERAELANLYVAGQTLWRVPLTRLADPDFNEPGGPPSDACEADDSSCGGDDPNDPFPTPDNSCQSPGASTIECQGQLLRETVPVVGTPYRLNYASDRVPGRRELYSLAIPLVGPTIASDVKSISLQITVAGQVTSVRASS